MHRIKLLPLIALLFVAFLIVGCGGGSHTASTTSTSSTTNSHSTPAPVSVPAPHKSCPKGAYVTKYGCSAHSATYGLPPSKGAPKAVAPAKLSSTRQMFDSVTLSTVPAESTLMAGYTSGLFITYLPMVHAFPHAQVVSIAINAVHHAMCLDVEPRDATASQVVGWYHADVAAGFKVPCFYGSILGDMPGIRGALNSAGITRSSYVLWDADWRGCPALDAGFDATQCTDHSRGLNLDESTVTQHFVDAIFGKPKPPPPPPDKYAIYDKTKRHLPRGVVASEHNTVATWDRVKCVNPVRRATCKSSRLHMQLLRDRAIFVANHSRGLKRTVHPARYGEFHLGARVHGMQDRLHQTK